jgi:glutamate carboxypeptidase
MEDIDLIHQLEEYLQDRLPHYLELLEQMVAINSFTSNPDGVDALGELTADIFSHLGFRAERIRSASPFYGDHLVMTRKTENNPIAPTIGLVSHLDTVFPPDEERRNDFSWRVEKDRIYGPGVVDIKGGTIVIYMMLAVLKALHSEVFDGVNWVILLNAAEEVLVPDFRQLCLEYLPSDALACLVFEGGRFEDQCFSLVTARKGMARFRIEVEGKAAHAGSTHRDGANAIVQLAHTVTRIAELTDYNQDITFNVGTIAGGTVVNRVPHLAVASGEARAFHRAVLDAGTNRLLALSNEADVSTVNGNYRCQVDVQILNRWAPWSPNDETERLFRLWSDAGAMMGVEVNRRPRGGLSDGNLIWDYTPTIDGLGPSGGNAHCSERSPDGSKDQEFVRSTSFVPKTVLNVLAVLKLVGRPS